MSAIPLSRSSASSHDQPIASIPVGLEPVAVAAISNDEVWVVNHLSDSISIVSVSLGQVTRTLLVGDEPRDIVVAESEALAGWLNRKLRDVIWPALAAQFAVREEELWLQDAFVVRYEPDGQRGLAPHLDDSELSFNIALSDPTSFGGGGTSFAAAAATLRPQRGQMVSHFGRVFHAGEPVTEGTRYILAGFVGARSLAREWRALRPQAGQKVELEEAAREG